MKKFFLVLLGIGILFGISSCKKDRVEGSSPQELQSSINDMASSLSTLESIKFNEALYILKKFAVKGEDDVTELKQLGVLLQGKNVKEIMALADATAQQNGLEWSSTSEPSLGMTNIFSSLKPEEHDPNDIAAKSMNLEIGTLGGPTSDVADGLVVRPILVDAQGKNLEFHSAALESRADVYSGGVRILTQKAIIQNNDYSGFKIRYEKLPFGKVINNAIDIQVTVNTSKKALKMTRAGILINANALQKPEPPKKDSIKTDTKETPITPEVVKDASGENPQQVVGKFLRNINTQNLEAAFSQSKVPQWGNLKDFSNPSSGFGSVKNIRTLNIATQSVQNNEAKVRAEYEVIDQKGNATTVRANYGLSLKDGKWVITSYSL